MPMPENVVSMDSASPLAAANNSRAANISKMSNLFSVNSGGSRRKYTKGGAATITVSPLRVSYPNDGSLNDVNTTMTKLALTSQAQKVGDSDWKQKGGRRRRSNRRRSNRRSKVKKSKLNTRRRK